MTNEYILHGDVCRPGAVMIEPGTTLRTVIFDIGGGMANGKKFRAVQIGGLSGGLLSENELDLPLDFKVLRQYGIRRGNSMITVLDEDRCMVDMVYRFMDLTQKRFCGKCVPCREGTRRMTEILGRLDRSAASELDLELLDDIAETVSVTAFCRLGRGASGTLLSAQRYFPQDFQAHISGHCPRCSGKDRRLFAYPSVDELNHRIMRVDPQLCKGCGKCARNCHAGAITGTARQTHSIDYDKCIKCYTCMEECPFGAISEVTVDG